MSTTPSPQPTEVRLSRRVAATVEEPQRAIPRDGTQITGVSGSHVFDPLMTAEDVAKRLRVSTDWVWDHSSRKKPFLPVIRMGGGTLRYRSSGIEAFIDERERLSSFHRRPR